jgi:hypothetical protein
MREEKATPRSSPPEATPLQEVNWLIISIITFVLSCFILALISFITYIILRDVGIL